jgi:hypothetical protein
MEGIFEMLHRRSAFFPGKETLSPGDKIGPDRLDALLVHFKISHHACGGGVMRHFEFTRHGG